MDRFYSFLNRHKLIKFWVKFFVDRIYHGSTAPFRRFFRTVEQQDMYLAQLNVVTETHKKTFGEFKNKYKGQDIAIIATGPSLNKYKPLENVINIGVNKTCKYNKVSLDYFFAIDYFIVKNYLDSLKDYPNKDLKIFLGMHPAKTFNFTEIRCRSMMPESKIIDLNANKFYLYLKHPEYNTNFNTEIDKTWLVHGGSCIFSAMQFALYTNPRRIYIVGCDCSTGYFDTKNEKIKPNKRLVRIWKELKQFADMYYPDTEIISVNPVGLKGIFTDLYQDEV